MAESDLVQQQFLAAADHFRVVSKTLASQGQQLKCYGIFKQANEGDAPTERPSGPAGMKWDAWNKNRGLSREMAMKRYVNEVRSVDPDWVLPGDVLQAARESDLSVDPDSVALEHLRDEFQAACEFAQSDRFKQHASHNVRNVLYGFYKQVTVGPCNVPCPSRLAGQRKREMWNAWSTISSMSQREAMDRYVYTVSTTNPEWAATHNIGRRRSVLKKEVHALLREEGKSAEPEQQPLLTPAQLLSSGLLGPSSEEEAAATNTAGSADVAPPREQVDAVYFVTGATGFLGKHLIGRLLKLNKKATILCLTRGSSAHKLQLMAAKRWGDAASHVVPVSGDITSAMCGLSEEMVRSLVGRVSHFFHLAASYDLHAGSDENLQSNVHGTRHAVQLSNALRSSFQYASSIAVAGDYKGIFFEHQFAEGQQFDHPYLQTKYEAELLVRNECTTLHRIYRPGAVIGSSEDGEADKIDGIYYLFKPLQKVRALCPSWMMLPVIQGNSLPIVPVDYVVNAMAEIALNSQPPEFLPAIPGGANPNPLFGGVYHLVDPNPPTLVELLNVFSEAAHGPHFTARPMMIAQGLIPKGVLQMAMGIRTLANAPSFIMSEIFDIPKMAVERLNLDCSYDDSATRQALIGSGIRCPALHTYAWKVWDFYERHMDRRLDKFKAVRDQIKGKLVVVTGASDGIGLCLAHRLARAGAVTVLVARSKDKLDAAVSEIRANGGNAHAFACDLTDLEDCDRMTAAVQAQLGPVHILVNNAGRSIRRSVEYQYDRFHDFQRLMQLNFFGALKVTLGFLPRMRQNKAGHIINISSIGVLTNAPRFSGYVASKAAFDAFSRCVASEVATDSVKVSTIYMPLVATKMVVSPGNKYDDSTMLSTDQAAEMVEKAIVTKNFTISTFMGKVVNTLFGIVPGLMVHFWNTAYRVQPERPPEGVEATPTASGNLEEAMAFKQLMHGFQM